MTKNKKWLIDSEETKLEYCCKVFGLDKIEAYRWGVEDLYQMALNIENLDPSLIPDFPD